MGFVPEGVTTLANDGYTHARWQLEAQREAQGETRVLVRVLPLAAQHGVAGFAADHLLDGSLERG